MSRLDDLRKKYAGDPRRPVPADGIDRSYTGWAAPLPPVYYRHAWHQDPDEPHIGLPRELRADRDSLPENFNDRFARSWCNHCGLPDAPRSTSMYEPLPPCPRCGSKWRWFGRIQDAMGSADGPPLTGSCMCCDEWRPHSSRHHGWGWWRVNGPAGCDHEHHREEVWIG